jgi:signal transduction histidine kinase/ActR/RegA family two-component response regulator
MEDSETFLDNLDRLGAWGILTTDENLKIVGWNRWLERHSGKWAADVIGLSLLEVFSDLIVRSLDRYYQEALQGQSSILSQRFHKYLLPMPPSVATSQLMHMQQTARISPLFEGGAIRGTLTLIEDVTERVVTELELRQQAERLEEANRHKDEFLAMLAHELRNPLAPIRNGIRVLDLVGTNNDEARETREMIERQVTHMTRLVDDLLDVSRIMRGKVRLQIAPCDLSAILQQVAQDYRPMLADNGVNLSVEIPTAPSWVLGDAVRLTQIVSNLLHNANKFTNAGGDVKLKAHVNREEQTAVIEIIDTGVGMTPETLARVFESFSQAETTLDRSKGGLGLGLALVKGLAELHGGSVEAASAGANQGSRFTVRLPIQETNPPLPISGAQTKPDVSLARRILLIEDNQDAALSMKRLLTHLGYEVELAFSGPDGLIAARTQVPDVIICDIGLPGLDGFGVARALRSEPLTRDIYLIAQSGYGQPEDIRKASDAGFDLHLLKPVSFLQLADSLKPIRRTSRPAADIGHGPQLGLT